MELKKSFLKVDQTVTVVVLFLIVLVCVFSAGAEMAATEDPKPVEKAAPRPLISAEKKNEEVKMVTKTLLGEVSGHGYNGIAVMFGEDAARGVAQEAWFNYEDDMKIEGYQSKKEIEDGDSVEVAYEQPEQGGAKVLKQIRLLKKRPPEVDTEIVEDDPSAESEGKEE